MGPMDHYRFADLAGHGHWMKQITRLEEEMSRELGEEVTLIAYSRRKTGPSQNSCRAGLDDE